MKNNRKSPPKLRGNKMNLTQAYIKKLFSAYYRAHIREFPDTASLPQREFAFLRWDHPGMVRHLGYPSKDFLLQYLISHGPRHSYHSATYYERPSAEKMEDKGYLGCDFVTDIDADHIPTACRSDHNYTICKACGNKEKGEKPEKCSKCDGTKFTKILWLCDECLNVSKQQAFNLVENFLVREFAIPLEAIQLNFSGHRGYHIHLDGDAWLHLDQDARREIADYVTGEGFSFKLWNFKKTQNVMQGFTLDQPGWPSKITREFYRVLKSGENNIWHYFKNPIYGRALNKPVIEKILNYRLKLITAIEKKSRIWDIPTLHDSSWHRIFYILRDHIKADIDVVVSIDLHRLIRLNGSLHGKAGFKVMSVPYETLKDYDPLVDGLAFPDNSENTITIQITAPLAPKIRIGDSEYGPYILGEKITLPLNAGLFLLCKDVALLVRN